MTNAKKKTRGAVGIIITTPQRDGVWISKRSENLPGENKWYAGYSQVPGGKIDPGETPRQAATRELMEETGLDVEGDLNPLLEVHGGTFTLPDGRPFDSTHYLLITSDKPQHTEPDASDAWRYVPVNQLHRLQFLPSTLAALAFALRCGHLKSPDIKPTKTKTDLTELIKPLKWAATPGAAPGVCSINKVGPTYTLLCRGRGAWNLEVSGYVGGRFDCYRSKDEGVAAANMHFRAVLSKYLKL
jgi:8-oxo-dGTP pyrophosphatase MutT (NUDIX family)